MRLSRQDKKFGRKGLVMLFILSLSTASCAEKMDGKGDASQFAKLVNKEQYKEVAAPMAVPVFKWDFGNQDVRSYTYAQEVRAKTDMGSFPGDKSDGMDQEEMSTRGALLIKSQGNGTAELVLKDMKMSAKMNAGRDKKPKAMEQTMPPSVFQGMKEDGSSSLGNSSQDMLLKMLFPLPAKSMKVGESVDVPMQMPFNAMGSVLQVTGRSRITLARYVKIGKRTCAQLNVDTDVSELKVPAELKGEYKCSSKGTAVFYFDVVNRYFVSGIIADLMQFSIDAPSPKMMIPGEKTTDVPERTKMSMISDNLIRVELME
jgi:hypothetical protein